MTTAVFGQTLLSALTVASVYAIVAMGLTLVFGVLDIVNFSQGQMVLGGAYTTFAVVAAGGGYWLGVALGVVVFAVLGGILDFLLFARTRDEPINGLLISVGLISIFTAVYVHYFGIQPETVQTPLTAEWHLGDVVVPASKVAVVATTILILLALSGFLLRTRPGAAVRAIGQNPDAAALMGIPVERMRTLTFALCAALAALGGGLLTAILPAEPALGDDWLVKAFIVLILGGAGSPRGAVIGAVIVAFVEAFATQLWSVAIANVVTFVLLIGVLYLRPRGIIVTTRASTL